MPGLNRFGIPGYYTLSPAREQEGVCCARRGSPLCQPAFLTFPQGFPHFHPGYSPAWGKGMDAGAFSFGKGRSVWRALKARALYKRHIPLGFLYSGSLPARPLGRGRWRPPEGGRQPGARGRVRPFFTNSEPPGAAGNSGERRERECRHRRRLLLTLRTKKPDRDFPGPAFYAIR